jgi:uncharacterized protein
MKYFFILFFVLFSNTLFSQNKSLSKDSLNQYNKDSLKEGFWIEEGMYAEEGEPTVKIICKGKYHNGLKENCWKCFANDSDTLLSEAYYKKGVNAHYYKSYYYDTGTLHLVQDYDKGKAIDYERNGEIISTQERLKNGISKHENYSSGKVYEIEFFNKNHEKEGKYLRFLYGKIAESATYANGLLNGVDSLFYSNGQIKSVCKYADQKREGVYKENYPSGKIKYEITYIDGIKDGQYTYYGEDGNVIESSYYMYGIKKSPKE